MSSARLATRPWIPPQRDPRPPEPPRDERPRRPAWLIALAAPVLAVALLLILLLATLGAVLSWARERVLLERPGPPRFRRRPRLLGWYGSAPPAWTKPECLVEDRVMTRDMYGLIGRREGAGVVEQLNAGAAIQVRWDPRGAAEVRWLDRRFEVEAARLSELSRGSRSS